MPTSQPSQQQQAANKDRIVDVWEDNLSDEFENIQNIVEDYPYIAMVCNLLFEQKYYFKYEFVINYFFQQLLL